MKRLALLLSMCSVVVVLLSCGGTNAAGVAAWTFAISGDSRNCGDLIMPVIASGAKAAGARFYWHLGDLRAIYKIDEDFAGLHRNDPLTLSTYQKVAWDDFEQNQIAPFAPLPFFIGIGNHETIPPMNRDLFKVKFRALLDAEPIRRERDPNDKNVQTYYHWREPGTDLIYLDNADSLPVFDAAQLKWAMDVIAADETNPDIKVVVVGMHASLPDSYSFDHSMNQGPDNGESGRAVYKRLLDLHIRTGKIVHVFSSHSHYYLENIYGTGMWQSNGGILPGTLIGTAGAQHYSVPPEVKSFTTWKENEYGYAVVHVDPPAGSVKVEFAPVTRKDISGALYSKFGQDAIDFCFSGNWRATLHTDSY